MSDAIEPIPCPERVRAMFEGFGVSLEENESVALGRYLALLLEANTRTNLTAVRDPDEAWERHLFDALTLLPVLSEIEGAGGRARFIDIGSGGGLPGIPLAIAMPGADFTLVDATKKKADFLAHAAGSLGLTNTRVIRARAEVLGQDRGVKTARGREGAHRGSYDGALARAVGRLAMIAELTVPGGGAARDDRGVDRPAREGGRAGRAHEGAEGRRGVGRGRRGAARSARLARGYGRDSHGADRGAREAARDAPGLSQA